MLLLLLVANAKHKCCGCERVVSYGRVVASVRWLCASRKNLGRSKDRRDRLSLFHPSPHLSLFYHLKKYLVAAEEIGVLHAKIY